MAKVFLGTMDITSRYRDLLNEFSAKEIDCYVVKQNSSESSSSKVHVCLNDFYSFYYKGIRPKRLQLWLQKNIGIRKKVFQKAVKDCDIFIFFWETIFADFSDIDKLRKLGKTIIFCFVGSDVRDEFAYKNTLNAEGRSFYSIMENEVNNNVRKKEYVTVAERFGDAIFSRPDQAQFQTKPYFRMVPFVNLSDFSLKTKKQNMIPIITHAPTSNRKKGTKFFHKVLDELKNEGLNFEYRPIKGLTQTEVRQIMLDADIVFDQLYLLGGGKVSVEAMAQGCVAVSAMGYGDFESPYAEKAPIVDVAEHNLKEVFRNLITNQEERQKIANLGPDFVRRNADCREFVEKILAIHNGERPLPDFTPNFSE